MVTPQLLVGNFSHPVWQAAVHEAQCFEAQNRTESPKSIPRRTKRQQVRRRR